MWYMAKPSLNINNFMNRYSLLHIAYDTVVKMQNFCNLIGWKTVYNSDIFNCYSVNINGMWNERKLDVNYNLNLY